MSSNNPNPKHSLYPDITDSNPSLTKTTPSSSNLYPTIDMHDLLENLFPDGYNAATPHHAPPPSAPPEGLEEILVKINGAIVNLIDKNYSVELASGDLVIVRLKQGDNVVAVLVRVGDEIQWPLAKDEAAVKLDDSHYFFSLRFPSDHPSDSSGDEEEKGKFEVDNNDPNMLNYGLTIASRGNEASLRAFDEILKSYSCFSEQCVSEKAKEKGGGLLDGGISSTEMKGRDVEGKCAAYWTTLAPNVEEYSTTSAKWIAVGSGHVVKGILWCGDVTMDRLKWGNEVMKRRMSAKENSEISPETLKRIKRVKKVTKRTEKVANAVLSGVLKVSGIFTSAVANSKVGKKFFGLLPGEIVLASLDGFSKVCDAVEVAGRNVMSTSSTVTTELVNHRYGEQAAKATNEGLGAAGHAIGTAWAAFKIRKALNPKSVLKPSSLAKSAVKAAAAEIKAKNSK